MLEEIYCPLDLNFDKKKVRNSIFVQKWFSLFHLLQLPKNSLEIFVEENPSIHPSIYPFILSFIQSTRRQLSIRFVALFALPNVCFYVSYLSLCATSSFIKKFRFLISPSTFFFAANENFNHYKKRFKMSKTASSILLHAIIFKCYHFLFC